MLKSHGEWLEQNELWMTKHREAVAKHDEAVARHDLVMAEIEDKLNGLIGVVDDLVRNRKSE